MVKKLLLTLLRWMCPLPILALVGCASIFTGTTQPLTVRAVNSENNRVISTATCTVTDEYGHVYSLANNPGSVTMDKGSGVLKIRCRNSGYHYAQTGVEEKFNAVTLVNILFWPGFIVDLADGAYMKYSGEVTVLMQPKT